MGTLHTIEYQEKENQKNKHTIPQLTAIHTELPQGTAVK